MPDPLDDWFIREVLPAEGMLMRYLRQNWRNPSELTDLRQEVYLRVYEAARKGVPEHTAAFVLVTARHLLIDRARRSQVVAIDTYADIDDLVIDELGPERHAAGRAQLDAVLDAIDTLPPRCREVVVLRRLNGMSQSEVAAEMGIAQDTVEKQVAKGMRVLADALFASSAGTTIVKMARKLRKQGTRG